MVAAAFADQLERGVDAEGGVPVLQRCGGQRLAGGSDELVVGGALGALHEVEGGEDARVVDVVANRVGLGEPFADDALAGVKSRSLWTFAPPPSP